MDVVQLREAIDDACKLLVDGLLHIFYFAHVKLPDAIDVEALVHFSWRLTLSL